ncbi:MAG: RIP metalloprotease RseP [Spirochaetes bacterium]|nr:RIP metalloprotease RseP [Spirochaetota bacterium]
MISIQILAAIVLLGFCVFVHELGHLLGGKMVGIKAKTFSLGYGKGFLKKKWGDTTYQITLIPFGGYCSFYGENMSDNLEGKSYEFFTASPWRRLVTVAMGPVFNLIFGILIFFIMNLVGFSVETNKIRIPEYFARAGIVTPAEKSGLKNGDRIVSINNQEVYSFEDVMTGIIFSKGNEIAIDVERDNAKLKFKVVPEIFSEGGFYGIGIMPYGNKILILDVVQGEAAEKAGLKKYDEIYKIDNVVIKSPEHFVDIIKSNAGNKISLSIIRSNAQKTVEVVPVIKETLTVKNLKNDRYNDVTDSVTVDKFNLVDEALNSGRLFINGIKITEKDEFINVLNDNSGKEISLKIPGGDFTGEITYSSFGYLGVSTDVAAEMNYIRYPIKQAFIKAMIDPLNFIVVNLKGLKMVFTGKVAVRENLSGPLRIAQIAGDTAYYRGIRSFIILMAKISIVLMIMNLLPIPAVDGSYILIFLIEGITRRRMSEKVMQGFQTIGFFILISLFIFIMYNDISNIFR